MASTTELEVISSSNLYANGYVIDFSEDGESLLLRDKLVIEPDVNDSYHTVRAGDKLRFIAYDKYKNYDSKAAQLWWAIADANDIFNPLDLTDWIGKDLRIPDYQKVKLLL